MELFHCVRCGHWPPLQPENRIRYFFSSCGRLQCERCVFVASSGKCMCGLDNCKLVEIKQNSGKDVRMFFMEPMALLQEALKKPFQVLQYQASLQKSFLRIVNKLAESTKTLKNENNLLKNENNSLRNENNSLKLEKNHLQKNNEELKQQLAQFKSKFNEISQSNAAASFLGGSPHSISSHSLNNQNDPLNIFRDMDRPNAQVLPNTHLQHQSGGPTPTPLVSPFAGGPGSNRMSSFQNTSFVQPNSPSPSMQNQQNSLFSQISHNTHNSAFSQTFSFARSTSSPNSYGTPASSVSQLSGAGLPMQSPFARRNDSLSGESDGRTPAIISRLRNLRCRATPNAASPYGNNN